MACLHMFLCHPLIEFLNVAWIRLEYLKLEVETHQLVPSFVNQESDDWGCLGVLSLDSEFTHVPYNRQT